MFIHLHGNLPLMEIKRSHARVSRSAASILRACLRALRSIYANDKDAFNLMARYVQHADEKVSQEAAVGVLYSQHFSSANDSVKDMLVSAGSALARRAYNGRIAKAEFKNFAEILLDSNYVDFAEPISNIKIEKMARRSFQNPRLRGRKGGSCSAR